MAAPKRRGIAYRVLCEGLPSSGAAATYAITEKLERGRLATPARAWKPVSRSAVRRALEDLQRKGLVAKYVADRRGLAPDDRHKLDVVDGPRQQIYLWGLVRTGKAWEKTTARCELYPAFLRRHGFAGARTKGRR